MYRPAAASAPPPAARTRASEPDAIERRAIALRADWQAKAESVGMIFHHTDGQVYWNESAYYRLTSADVELIESATNELWARSLDAVEHVISRRRYADLGIPEAAIPLIETSWNDDHPSIYGRFDLGYRAGEPPKLFEFNADTPTMLLEAAVVQWKWKEEVAPAADQFNSIHEKLIAKWRSLREYLREPVHFAHTENVEDLMTTTYLRDTAEQAGYGTVGLHVSDIGWHHIRGFTDLDERPILNIFKLYPWEWLLREPFAAHLSTGLPYWIEPAWRMILSNKSILPILWELFPDHPNLLPAFGDRGRLREWVEKPRFGREGHNVTVHTAAGDEQQPGDYTSDGFVYQQYFELPVYDGRRAIVGSWVVDQESAGVGIRESEGLITKNESPFVPHVIEDR